MIKNQYSTIAILYNYTVLINYHQLFFLSSNSLTWILKLIIRVFLFLVFRVKTSILSVGQTMGKLNHGIKLNQNTTLKAN